MSKLKLLLKVLCAIGLVTVLARFVDWRHLPAQFAGVSPLFALSGFAGLSVQFLTSTWKWRHAMRIHDLDGDFWPLVEIYGTGFFMNNFLPSAIGGDAYRAYKTLPVGGTRSRAVAAIIVERIVGFAALLALGCLGALELYDESPLARAFFLINVGGAIVVLLLAIVVRAGWLRPLGARLATSKMGQAVTQNLTYLRNAGVKWWPLVGSSLVFQILAITIIHWLFRSLHVDVSLAACAMIAAVAGLATVLPISINGIGVVEGSFAGTAVALGVDYEIALAVALLIRLLVVPATIIFGALYLWRGERVAAVRETASSVGIDTAKHAP